ncbi:hypothetical protein HH1059_00440 [Halorhodospira halochloris]|uniref:Uncharacterized protein n=1 Tax=Halorhodospira halochloris TaxID=1052 RepID=A0A2Z6EZ95_HALHR|nr:hypothetical protein HH1059_00440 [Halorhodospira halochloris]
MVRTTVQSFPQVSPRIPHFNPLLVASKNFAGATIRPGVEDAMNPTLEASWLHPWRQDLHTGADGGAGEVFEAPYCD